MTVLITGGTRGIGYAIALKFAGNNYDLILNYVNDYENACKVKEKIESEYNVKVMLVKANISDENDVKYLYEESLKNFKSIDILINNAGIANDCLVEDKNIDDFKKVLDVNLIGPFLTSKYFGKDMYKRKMGNIINISSTNAIDTYYPEGMDYDASKAGLMSLTKNFAVLYSPYVRVNAIASGWVNTDMNKNMDNDYKKNEENKILLKRFADASEIANVVYFLATKDASYINGSIIRVDGGK